ncbi:MAG: hypothetical protein FWF06_06685, partial [Symbiobacteriaceae bacterium]|nr:hypothetical protein [Symbiobacteriaceae bacterium]
IRGEVNGYSTFSQGSFLATRRDLKYEYVLLPVWLLAAKYHNETFLLAMNGQSGKWVGRLPMNNGRVASWAVILFMVILVASFVLLGGFNL